MGKIHNVEKLTDNRFVNLYHVDATSVHNTPVSYFVASRAKTVSEMKLKTGKNCNRAVSPAGCRPVFVKSAENHEKCWKIAVFCLKNRSSCGTIYSIFSKGDGTCAGLDPTAALYSGAAAAGDPHPAGPGKRLSVG